MVKLSMLIFVTIHFQKKYLVKKTRLGAMGFKTSADAEKFIRNAGITAEIEAINTTRDKVPYVDRQTAIEKHIELNSKN